LIFEPDEKVTEIKRLECADLTFTSKKKAEAHGLKLCRAWVDEQQTRISPEEEKEIKLL
jgi:hypothetical protein